MIDDKLRQIGREKKHLEGVAHSFVPELVSVCMPNYNKDKYVYQAIQSIVQQSYCKVELCIVDDDSSDNSRAIIANAIRTFEGEIDIEYKVNKRRVGTAWAQNMAYYMASGEYIANMDSDDMSSPERIQEQLKYLKDNGLDVCASRLFRLDDSKRGTAATPWMQNRTDLMSYQFGTLLMKRKIIEVTGGLKKEFIGTEDYGFLKEVKEKGYQIGQCPKFLYQYRMNATQRSKLFHGSPV